MTVDDKLKFLVGINARNKFSSAPAIFSRDAESAHCKTFIGKLKVRIIKIKNPARASYILFATSNKFFRNNGNDSKRELSAK